MLSRYQQELYPGGDWSEQHVTHDIYLGLLFPDSHIINYTNA